jgi:hypothetical protein
LHGIRAIAFYFMNTSPVLIPFALLSLALRIGAGIKRCHRGFTIDLQSLAITCFKGNRNAS